MRYSTFLGRTLREVPKDSEAISHKLLARAGYIDQLIAGVYTFLPLGWRVHRKIEQIIREEMESIGGQELHMPVIQKKEQWLETGRWEGPGEIDPPLFKFEDRRGRILALGPTHEEVVTDLARRFISSYKDLPLAVFQIQNKFRNEMRPTGGILRTREFYMKDLYSFHADESDLNNYYLEVIKAYERIFARCGLDILVIAAHSGTIGGSESHEFAAPSEVGEGKAVYCEHCDFASNVEKSGELKNCPECGQAIFVSAAIELAHLFKLGSLYSEKMKAYFTDHDGKRKPFLMGCYGIGLGRVMAAVVESSHDDRGIIWPSELTPFDVHLVSLSGGESAAEKIYSAMSKSGLEVLFDDREEPAGVKLHDADLVGIPVRIIVSKKSLEASGVEVSSRKDGKSRVVAIDKIADRIKKIYEG